MNLNKSIYTFLLITCLVGCKENKNSSESTTTSEKNLSENQSSINKFALVDCIKKGLYYINEIDIKTYDSISTNHFHEVLDYIDTNAIKLNEEIKNLSIYKEDPFFKEALDSLNNLQQTKEFELKKYSKYPIGYVFVHTFKNKNDTLSAIIMANSELSNADAILVKTVTDLNPDNYTNNVKAIEK